MKVFNHDGEFALGAYQAGFLVGLGGIHRDPYQEDPAIGRVHHLYVSPVARRNGTGRALLNALIAQAAELYRVVTLRAIDAEAARFYTNAGFTQDERYLQTSHWREI